MIIEQLTALINGISPFIVVKLLVLTLLLLYMAFAYILVRQTSLMVKVVEAEISPVLELITSIHFLGTVFVFILGLVIL